MRRSLRSSRADRLQAAELGARAAPGVVLRQAAGDGVGD